LTFAVSATIVPLIPVGLILSRVGGYDIILQFSPRQFSCYGVDVIKIAFLPPSTTREMVVGWFLLLGGFIYEVWVYFIIPKNILKCSFILFSI